MESTYEYKKEIPMDLNNASNLTQILLYMDISHHISVLISSEKHKTGDNHFDNNGNGEQEKTKRPHCWCPVREGSQIRK